MLGFLDIVRMHSRMLRSGNIFRSHSFLILWSIKQIRDTVIINYLTSSFFVGFRRIKLTQDEFFSLFPCYYFALVCYIFCKLPICTMCFEYVMSASAMSMASQQNIKSHRMHETPITRPIVAAAASPPSTRLAATITTSQMNVFEAFHLGALKYDLIVHWKSTAIFGYAMYDVFGCFLPSNIIWKLILGCLPFI